jgi:malonate transporter and related proteins
MLIVSAPLTAFVVLLLGQAIAQRRFIPWDTWGSIQLLNYYLFIPCLFFYGLATADFDNMRVLGQGFTVTATMLVGALLLVIWRWRRGVDQTLTPALLEATIRANMPLGFALAYAFFSSAGVQLMAIAGLFYLPTAILLGAYVSQASATPGHGRWLRLGFIVRSLRLLARHPIFIGALAGLLINLLGERLNLALVRIGLTFGLAAIPLGILAAGAAMNTKTLAQVMGSQPRALAGVVLLKLVALPLVAGLLAWALGLHGVTAQTVVALAALPCVAPRFSVGATVDAAPPVLNAAATATTLLWVVTLPLALWILT